METRTCDGQVWLSVAHVVVCLSAYAGGGGKIWLQLSCVTTFTCLIVCGLRVEGLRGGIMVMVEIYCDQSMVHISACIMGSVDLGFICQLRIGVG